jgi:hypothetical protein
MVTLTPVIGELRQRMAALPVEAFTFVARRSKGYRVSNADCVPATPELAAQSALRPA